ncbi:hypothetical protein KP803_10385 [Vibrio sp. ZSDE26]|uniref:Uncharacterized protein n=1 Tax=Vibrio amylolyticus TaxID=2847292 RepID=A0A9X1XMJ0_9VIBR|nr:hypothetical protein [Vibrio amylolyticus]MCK6263680.1 hypothetical protein [Vibrio amylolyticus]
MPKLNQTQLRGLVYTFKKVYHNQYGAAELQLFEINSLTLNDIQDMYNIWESLYHGEYLTQELLHDIGFPTWKQKLWFGSLERFQKAMKPERFQKAMKPPTTIPFEIITKED